MTRRQRILANRAVAIPTLTVRQFFRIDGLRKAALVAFNLFLALVPLTMIAFAFLSSHRRNFGLGEVMVRQFGLHGTAARVVLSTFPANVSVLKVASAITIISFALSGFDVASAIQTTFAEAWDSPVRKGWRSSLRGAGWFVLVFVQFGALHLVHRMASVHGVPALAVTIPFALLTGYLLWLVSPMLMLHQPVRPDSLRPGAVLGAVATAGLWIASRIVLPGWFDWYSRGFGAMGVALALLSWAYVVAIVWVLVIVATWAYWQHTMPEKEIAAISG
jgi:uncharacterized BrkB/YihY/UPF0761 family membrane protein